jgi:hypothetical protein
MTHERVLKKVFAQDMSGTHTTNLVPTAAPLPPASEAPWADESQSVLYAEVSPSHHKKHSPSFINQRRKVRHLAENRLIDLSTQLLKLADEIRYYDPLMAEVLDEAWDATDAAIAMMQSNV